MGCGTGKSGIHGFGIFTKQPHKAGDMVINPHTFHFKSFRSFVYLLQLRRSLMNVLQVIEYTGEIVRPPIADRREHLIYNSLVVSRYKHYQITCKKR